MKNAVPGILVLLSGFAGLVYQLLWMRQLGLLFGNTAHAAAVTLSVFFAGLAAGSWFWGKRVSARPDPLRTYAWIEVGIGGTALLYFGVLTLFYLVYPVVYQAMGSGTVLFLVKCLLAMALVFPPAFFMGGTVPAMGQYLITREELFGTITARIYGINTVGAALGVLVAAFLLIPRLGFRMTCVCAMVMTGCIAAVAFRMSRETSTQRHAPTAPREPNAEPARPRCSSPSQAKPDGGLSRPTIALLAFLSGFSVLALEVLWTRMFAQVHENSVYSFAVVLVIVLSCLSLGALLAAFLASKGISPRRCLSLLMVAGGVALVFSPMIFVKATGNFSMLPTNGTFAQYVVKLFTVGFLSVGPACLLLGTIFPFLMKGEERFADRPGRSIGRLSAVNTIGAILGSLLCGLLLLRTLGMWWTVHSIAATYLLVGMVLPAGFRAFELALRGTGAFFLVLLFTALAPSGLPVLGTDPSRGPQKLVEVWETSDCSVAVVEDDLGHLAIKLNSNYVLGSTDAIPDQLFQARVPLFAYPETESVFFLGIGTGITAGGALNTGLFRSVKRVVACELVPEIVTAAKRYVAGGAGRPDYTDGLFTDERVEILIGDGRHYLMAADDAFDMINADLFLPYRSGAGSLYSREHFENVEKKLRPGGVFVQWLPLFQLTDLEFGTITRTMLGVFDHVTLWRNNFMPGREIVALVGHTGGTPLPRCELDIGREKSSSVDGMHWRDLPALQFPCNEQSISLFYCGNVTAARDWFDDYPVNTDDRPVIEYSAPLSMRKATGDTLPPTMVGPRLADLVDRLLANCPPDRDPMLANRTAANRRLPLAGAALHRVWVGYALSDPDMCRRAWDAFVREWTNDG